MNNELDRKLPFSLEAEQALLGSILIDPMCMDEIAPLISAGIFTFRSTPRFSARCSRCI